MPIAFFATLQHHEDSLLVMSGLDMDEKKIRQANAFRLRAEEIRTCSENARDPACRAALMGIAEGYESLADMIERMLDRPAGVFNHEAENRLGGR